MEKLGALALSSDILEKANIGLWAFELDEGKAPRMYADKTMLKLLGLEHQLSPEETYHAWYDHIDKEHYDEVAASVEKMSAGTHAEVQYPWHHPNGDTLIVRCGGVRNYEYTEGIRIEGTHQNVTDVAHFQKKLGTIALDKDILTNAHIGLWAFELDEGSEPRMYADDTMLNLLGLEHELSPEETYHAWYDHIDPKHYSKVAQTVNTMTGGVHAEVQYPWHHPDGTVWTVRCGGVRNYAYTKGVRIEGTHQNITSMTHYQKRSLTDMLASLMENFLRVYFLDPYTGSFDFFAGNTRVKDDGSANVNSDFYQLCNRTNQDIVFPDDQPVIERMYSRDNLIAVLESGEQVEFTVRRITDKKNECVYVKNLIAPFEDSDGTKMLFVGMADVTAGIVSKLQIDEYSALVEGLSNEYHSLWLIDGDTHMHKFIRSSDEKTLKSGVHIALAQPNYDLALPEYIDTAVFAEDRERVLREASFPSVAENTPDKGVYSVTYRRYNNDGGLGYHQMCYAKVDSAGKTDYICAFRDADSEIKKQLENQKILADALIKADEANSAKTSFLFNMSHDIRTPMNAIIGFTDIAEKHIDDHERVQEALSKVRTASEHLLSLINDVLDMSRVESGQVKIEEEPVFIDTMNDNLYSIVAGTAEAKDIILKSTLSPSIEHHWIYADRMRLMRVLTNVVSNSVKYTNPGGKIDILTEELPCENDGCVRYRYTVSDTGIGMSREFLEHIFEPFTRAESATKSGVIGTGLGMAITKSLVELMGGRISIESELGKGTTVIIEFENRIAEAVDPIAELPREIPAGIKGKKILLVEDNELNREIATEILEEEGVIIDTAEDGDIAVEKMRNASDGQYDLILMDIQMPRMNGYEATMAIRNLPNSYAANIPIIAMTANAFEEDRHNAFEAGMNGHISKPIDVPSLLSTMTEILM